MLACADTRPRTKKEGAIRIYLEWVILSPSIRIELEWIFIRLLLKMVGLYLNRYKTAHFDGTSFTEEQSITKQALYCRN